MGIKRVCDICEDVNSEFNTYYSLFENKWWTRTKGKNSWGRNKIEICSMCMGDFNQFIEDKREEHNG